MEVRLFLDGGEIRLVDTAGIADKAADALDALSMEKSRQILSEADLKILLVDASAEANLCGSEVSSGTEIKPDFILYTKQDKIANKGANGQVPEGAEGSLLVSSKTGAGLLELKSFLNERLFKNDENSEDLWITSEREKACLEDALAGIDRVLFQLRTNPAVELLAFEMQVVRRSLQSITGEISSEDVLQSIFAGFCIGK